MNDLDKYSKLRQLLEDKTDWPSMYMFKFIVPNKDGNVDRVIAMLPSEGQITFKHTENLKYVSVTCTVLMPDADQIIEVMDMVAQVPGVMTL